MEHIQKDDIIIRKGILHILDSHTGYLGLSSQLLEMGPDLMEFVRGHIFKIMESDDAKRCQFNGSVSPVLSLLESMEESDIIVAINKDETAPIFDVADYGIVGDLNKIVPALTEKLRAVVK